MLNCLAVGLGGFVGSVLRYLVSLIPFGGAGEFPINTLLTNVLGAFAIGLIAAALSRGCGLSPRAVLLLKTGVCGGFTTFSTFALETSGLMQSGKTGAAIAYIVLSIALSVGAVLLADVVI